MYSLVLMTMLQSGAAGPGCYGVPGGGGFRLALARVDSKGILLIRDIHTGPQVVEEYTINREKDGEKVPVPAYIKRTRVVEEVMHLDSTVVKVFDTSNKAVDPKKLPELLKEETAIVFCAQEQKIDPRLLPALQKGTLIVVLPSPPHPVGGHGYGVPPQPMPVLPMPAPPPPPPAKVPVKGTP